MQSMQHWPSVACLGGGTAQRRPAQAPVLHALLPPPPPPAMLQHPYVFVALQSSTHHTTALKPGGAGLGFVGWGVPPLKGILEVS